MASKLHTASQYERPEPSREALERLANQAREKAAAKASREAPATTAQVLGKLDLNNVLNRTRSKLEACKNWIAEQKKIPCCRHCKKPKEYNLEAMAVFFNREGVIEPKYHPCVACRSINEVKHEAHWLKLSGVPEELLLETFETYKPRCPQEERALEQARKFTQVNAGFLFLLGTTGTGKSHLATCILRAAKSGLFITQADLLEALRNSYGSRNERTIEKARTCRLLVLDEIGLSAGGKDEFPMLHRVMAYRNDNKLKTVGTGNLTTKAQLVEIFGERMEDRWRRSAFPIQWFAGESFRAHKQESYFD